MTKLIRVPVITLPNVVFFPNTSLPLYVVDPVYEKLIEQAATEGSLVAVALSDDVYTDNINQTPSRICGVGNPIILERMEDGVLKVLMKGSSRVQLKELEQHLPYPIYLAEFLKDTTEPCDFIDDKIYRLKEILFSWLKENVTNDIERNQFVATMTTDSHIIDYISTFIIHDPEIRQLLLENTSFVERVKLLDTLIKDHSPFHEDCSTRDAILDFESIEKIAKCAH